MRPTPPFRTDGSTNRSCRYTLSSTAEVEGCGYHVTNPITVPSAAGVEAVEAVSVVPGGSTATAAYMRTFSSRRRARVVGKTFSGILFVRS